MHRDHVWIYTQIWFVMRASGSGGLNDGVASAGALNAACCSGSYDMLITLIDPMTPGPCSVRRNGAGELVRCIVVQQ